MPKHLALATGAVEWYTPEWLIEAVRVTMGSIDLDPASTYIANERVKATRFYDVTDDGLQLEWRGNIYLNPPYGRTLIGPFVEKFFLEKRVARIRQAVILTNASTETQWAQRLLGECDRVCFIKSRVRFYNPATAHLPINERPPGPLQGQMATYFAGGDNDRFSREFGKFGTIFTRHHYNRR